MIQKKLPILFGVFLVLLSCSEESPLSTQNSNLLNFNSTDEIFNYSNDPSRKPIGFESFEDLFLKAVDEISTVENENDHQRLLEKYQDILTITDETYSPTISNSVYRMIINRERMYRSGDYLHKVLNNEFIIVTDMANMDALRQINSVQGIDEEKFTVVKYQGESTVQEIGGRSSANCGSDLRQDYFLNASNCRDDRRAWVHGYTWYAISGTQYTPSVFAKCYGELRTGTFCRWKPYTTQISTRNCSLTVTIVINGITQSYSRTSLDMPNYDGTVDEYEHFMINGPLLTGPINWAGGSIPTIQFTAIHLEGKTRGTNNNWAVLNCQ